MMSSKSAKADLDGEPEVHFAGKRYSWAGHAGEGGSRETDRGPSLVATIIPAPSISSTSASRRARLTAWRERA
jgi:hypothetical protein